MKKHVKTIVNCPVVTVIEHFNQNLFLSLKPPNSELNIKEFNMEEIGGKINLEIKTPLGMQNWLGEISYLRKSDYFFEFTDIGLKLPFPLKQWSHTHTIEPLDKFRTIIKDRIVFKSTFILSPLVWMGISLMFWLRKPQYRRYYNLILRNQ